LSKGRGGQKSHNAAKKKREKWVREHSGYTRKSWAAKKRQNRLQKKLDGK